MGQAVGIPNTAEFGKLDRLVPGKVYDISIQHHIADKAGEHVDFRIGDKDIGLLSWAIPQARLPNSDERLLAVQQPLHEYSYRDFEGEIREGYGKGKVQLKKLGKVLVTDKTPNAIHLTVISDRYPERYALIRPQSSSWKEKDWLIVNTTPTKPIDYDKLHFRSAEPSKLESLISKDGEFYASPKIDGAHVIVVINGDKLDVFSYRISKVTGGNVLHTERLFQIRPKVSLPKSLNGTILKGELYGVRDGKAIPVNELSAMLNSSIFNSLQRAQRDGVKFRVGLFDIYRYGNTLVDIDSVDFSDRQRLLREISEHLDQDRFHIIPYVSGKDRILELWKEVSSGKHPLTQEGIVLYPQRGAPLKVKTREEKDVYIREIYPGTGRFANAAGGFTYSLEPDGPIVGNVGTGLDDDFREEIWKNRDDYIGRKARVAYQEQFPSGALRAPVFIALHEDYPSKTEKEGSLDLNDDLWFKVLEDLYTIRHAVKTGDAWYKAPALELPAELITKGQTYVGGPTPLLEALITAAFGTAPGYLFGNQLAIAFGSKRPHEFGKKMAILGSLLAAVPSALINAVPAYQTEGIKGLFKATPIQKMIAKKASWTPEDYRDIAQELEYIVEDVLQQRPVLDDTTKKAVKKAFDNWTLQFDPDDWGKVVMDDPYLPSWHKVVSTSIPLVSSVTKGNTDTVTVGDVVRTTYNMGLGSLLGAMLGSTAVTVLGLPREARNFFVESGRLAGIIKSILNPIKS